MGYYYKRFIVYYLCLILMTLFGKSHQANLQDKLQLSNVEKTPIIPTKYGQIRGTFHSVPGLSSRVATYLGVPYATPPVGTNRFSPTRTLSQWVGVHEAMVFGPACPQKLPDVQNETLALKTMSRSKLAALKRMLPILKHQSEDCLYLNVYVPQKGKKLSK